MKGYKAFNPDLTCRGMQYEVGKSYSFDEEPILCQRGFHFCKTIRDCSNFYELLGTGNRACEVEARGTIKHGAGVCVTDQLYIVRELSRIEINRGIYACCGDSEGNGGGVCRLGYRFGYGNGIADGYGLGNGDGTVNGKGDGNGYGDGGGYGAGDGIGNEVITRVLTFK